jgi:hypothetical protein
VSTEQLDPRWRWIEARSLSGTVRYRKAGCNHLEVEPATSGGQVVAHLCRTCDAQLPAEWAQP